MPPQAVSIPCVSANVQTLAGWLGTLLSLEPSTSPSKQAPAPEQLPQVQQPQTAAAEQQLTCAEQLTQPQQQAQMLPPLQLAHGYEEPAPWQGAMVADQPMPGAARSAGVRKGAR